MYITTLKITASLGVGLSWAAGYLVGSWIGLLAVIIGQLAVIISILVAENN